MCSSGRRAFRNDRRLPPGNCSMMSNELVFSAAGLWEITIKSGLGRDDFAVDARVLRRVFIDNGYVELAISSEHAVAISQLPAIHKDPFDRMLITQSIVGDMTLITSDETVCRYSEPIGRV